MDDIYAQIFIIIASMPLLSLKGYKLFQRCTLLKEICEIKNIRSCMYVHGYILYITVMVKYPFGEDNFSINLNLCSFMW